MLAAGELKPVIAAGDRIRAAAEASSALWWKVCQVPPIPCLTIAKASAPARSSRIGLRAGR